jgi:hypothetical protein
MRKLLPLLAMSLIASLARAADPPERPSLRRSPRQGHGLQSRRSIQRLKAIDANKDGLISKEEFPGAPEGFKAFDRNADGTIDATELPPLRLLARERQAGRRLPTPPTSTRRARGVIKKSAEGPGTAPRIQKKPAASASVKRELAQLEAAFKLLARKPQLMRELVKKPAARKAIVQIHGILARTTASRLRATVRRQRAARTPQRFRRSTPRPRPQLGPRPFLRRGQSLGMRRLRGGPYYLHRRYPAWPPYRPAVPRPRARR